MAVDLLPMVADAERATASMTDVQDRMIKIERLAQIRQGAFDTIVVRDGEKPVCFIAFQPIDKEVTFRFGHILPGYEKENVAILEQSVTALTGQGMRSIFSIFNWPEQETFTEAAEAIGFLRFDRMNMVRKPDAGNVYGSLPPGIAIMPWSPEHVDGTARIIFENAFPEDRSFHRPYRTREGCLAYVRAIIANRYGEFLPELSLMASQNDRNVGVLLVTRLPQNIGINIVDLAVDGAFRRRGIARSLIGRLIDANAAASNADVVLTVTKSNLAAFNLYQHMGFKVTSNLGYYVYDTDVRSQK